MGAFDGLASRRTVVVTTYKRDGTAVPTPVNIVVVKDHAYFRTWSTTGKVKRLRRLVPLVHRLRHYQTVHYELTAR